MVRDLSNYGMKHFFRVSIGSTSDLRKFLKAHNTRTGKKYSTKNLQYCTVWKKDRLTKQKKVSKILIKAPLQESFLCIDAIVSDAGITVDDIKAFLDRRGAEKIIFEKPWRSKN